MAGFLALVLFIVTDFFLFGFSGPWAILQPRAKGAVPRGIVSDQLEFRRLRDAPEAQHRAIVVGSSRANTGFQRPGDQPHLIFGKIAHAGIGVFQIRSLVDEALDLKVDTMVMVLSEFDLNIGVTANPQTSFRSFSAIRDLAAEAGAATCFEHRVAFYRLAAAAFLNSYRFRRVLHSAFVDDLRRFRLADRVPGVESASALRELVRGGKRRPLDSQNKARIKARIRGAFPHLSARGVGMVFNQIHRISRGSHSEVQAGLLRRAVRRLVEAGVKVVIAEAPVHPLAVEIYDPTIRKEFVALAANLESQFGARFIPLETSGPYEPEDFKDMTHLAGSGGAKLTAAIVATVDDMLR